MNMSLSIPKIVAHEILVLGLVFTNSWAISTFLLAAKIAIPSPSIFLILYIARVCVGAYRYLSEKPFTFSTKKVYPPLFTTSVIFLLCSYFFLYFWKINLIIGFPFSIRPVPMLVIAIGFSLFFIFRQKKIAQIAEQDAAANP